MNAAPAFDCLRCEDKRRVWNAFLKRMIRCPLCTQAVSRRTPGATNALLRAAGSTVGAKESQRLVARIEQHMIEAAFELCEYDGLPKGLRTTDRILQRWAAAPSGMPSENPDAYHVSRPPPLDDRTQEAVSDSLKSAPAGVSRFIGDWYCRTGIPTDDLARRRHLTRQQVLREWEDCLEIMRSRFLRSPHVDLVAMVRAQP